MPGIGKNAGNKKRSWIVYILIFAFLAAIIVTAGLLFFGNYKSHFRAEAERDLTAIAELKVNELANWRRGRMNDGLVFYRNSVFSSLVRRYFERPEDKEAQYQLRVWLGHFQVAWKYDRIMLLDGRFAKKMIIPDGPERSVSYVSPSFGRGPARGESGFRGFLLERSESKNLFENPGSHPRETGRQRTTGRPGPAPRSWRLSLPAHPALAHPQPDGRDPARPPRRQ